MESRFGFTTPKALGKAVVRNRIRRRMREAVRLRRDRLPSGWMIVFNPRRALLEAAFPNVLRDVERVFSKCKG
jgi:ribonuclease P protein component